MKRHVSRLLILSLLFVACAGALTGADAKNVGQIVVGRLGDAAYLDPNAPVVGIAEVPVTQQIYEGLVTVSNDGTTIIPCLATSWKISADGLTYTFTLKPGVKFSDGTPVKGEDWVWSFLRARDLETSEYRFIAEAIKDVKATNTQVVITLKNPWAPFLADLCCFNMVLGCKAYYDRVGEKEYNVKPLGTGPYKLKEWKKEEYILLEANTYYHVKGLPKTKEVKFTVVPDDNTRMMQLQAGQIDILNDMPFTMVDQAKADKNLKVQVFPSTQIRYLILNTTIPPFNDPKVRKALTHGLNKAEMSSLIAGEFGAPVAALVSESQGKWHNAKLKVLDYAPETAKKMLADAGYTDPVAFTVSIRAGSQVYEQVATLMKSQLDKAGFNVTIEMLERASLTQKYQSLSHQATVLQWVDDITDPSGVTGWTVDYDQCNAWYTGLNDKALDDLNTAASKELNEKKRVQMYQDIQQKIYDNANVVPLFRNGFAYAYSAKINGLFVSPFSVFFVKDITKTR